MVKTVPLVIYKNGQRFVVGQAEVDLESGQFHGTVHPKVAAELTGVTSYSIPESNEEEDPLS